MKAQSISNLALSLTVLQARVCIGEGRVARPYLNHCSPSLVLSVQYIESTLNYKDIKINNLMYVDFMFYN